MERKVGRLVHSCLLTSASGNNTDSILVLDMLRSLDSAFHPPYKLFCLVRLNVTKIRVDIPDTERNLVLEIFSLVKSCKTLSYTISP